MAGGFPLDESICASSYSHLTSMSLGACKCQWSLSATSSPLPSRDREPRESEPHQMEHHRMTVQPPWVPPWKEPGGKSQIPPTYRKLSRTIFCKQSLPRTSPHFLFGPQPLSLERKLGLRGQEKCCPRHGRESVVGSVWTVKEAKHTDLPLPFEI